MWDKFNEFEEQIMKHFIINKLSLLIFVLLALPMQSFGMFKWFTCGCGTKRQSLCYKPLPMDEYKLQEPSSECHVQPHSLVDIMKKYLPDAITPEILELMLMYRSLEMKKMYIFRDIYSSVKEITGQKLELQSSDEEKPTVELYDIETGKKLEAYPRSRVEMKQIRSGNIVGTIDLSNGGRAVFCTDGTIRIFDDAGDQQAILPEPYLFKSEPLDERLMAPLTDGGFVIAVPRAYNHYVIKQWKAGQKTLQTIVEIKQPVYSVAEYHNGFLAVSVSFKEVVLINLRTGERVGSLAGDQRHETDLLPLSGGRLLTYVTQRGREQTEFKVWE